MPLADRLIRWALIAAVLVVASVVATVSYFDIRDLVANLGHQSCFIAAIFPISIDGCLATSNLTLLYCSRYQVPPPRLARFTLWVGIGATLVANCAHGLPYGWPAAVIGAWPAVSLTLSTELLVWVVGVSRSLDSREVVVFEKPKDNNDLDAVLTILANDRSVSGRQISRETGLPYPKALMLARQARAMLNGSDSIRR